MSPPAIKVNPADVLTMPTLMPMAALRHNQQQKTDRFRGKDVELYQLTFVIDIWF
jgi:hypothetical protein